MRARGVRGGSVSCVAVRSSASVVRPSPRATLLMPAGAGNRRPRRRQVAQGTIAIGTTQPRSETATHGIRRSIMILEQSDQRLPGLPAAPGRPAGGRDGGLRRRARRADRAARDGPCCWPCWPAPPAPGFVLEIGLAIGYSALHIARALPEYGKVISLERDMHMAALAKTYLARDPAGARVEILLGDAHETLPGLREIFDVIFIDADKVGLPGLPRSRPRPPAQDRPDRDRQPAHGRRAWPPGAATTTGRSARSTRPVTLNRRLADDPGTRLRAAAARRRRRARAAPRPRGPA